MYVKCTERYIDIDTCTQEPIFNLKRVKDQLIYRKWDLILLVNERLLYFIFNFKCPKIFQTRVNITEFFE